MSENENCQKKLTSERISLGLLLIKVFCLQMKSGFKNLCYIEEIKMLIPKREPSIPSPFKERADFYNANKLQNETVTEYYTKLLNHSIICEFNEYFNDLVLRDKFITGFRSGSIFEYLCNQSKDITLSEALNLALKIERDIQNSSTEMITKIDSKASDIIDQINISEEVS